MSFEDAPKINKPEPVKLEPIVIPENDSVSDNTKDQKEVEKEHDMKLVRIFTGDSTEKQKKAAFEEIVARHRGRVLNTISQILYDRRDAEEIMWKVFDNAYRNLANFRGDSSLATWLHIIATRLSINRRIRENKVRKQDRHISLDQPLNSDSDNTFKDILPSETPSPSDEVTREEFAGRIAAAMEKISPMHREILTLRNLLNRSYEEIAQALGITVGTVKSRIARARKSLREFLPEDFPYFLEKDEAEKQAERDRRKNRYYQKKILEKVTEKYSELAQTVPYVGEKSADKTNLSDKKLEEELLNKFPHLKPKE